MRILHVVSDSSNDMGYGGVLTNTLRMCRELTNQNYKVTFWSTYYIEPLNITNMEFHQYQNSRFSSTHPFVLQFSFRNFATLTSAISKSEIIHVHFARELNSVVASLIAIFLRKSLVLQTHGMIEKSTRISTKIWDHLFSNFIIQRADLVLALQKVEFSNLIEFSPKKIETLPNGITPYPSPPRELNKSKPKIVFISRINARKRPEIFLDLAEMAQKKSLPYEFAIYGAIEKKYFGFQESIKSRNLGNIYKGVLNETEVFDILLNSSILVLPSSKEPFPMCVLEALSVGTPVIVMNDCGIADEIGLLDPLFVCTTDINAIAEQIQLIIAKYRNVKSRKILKQKFEEVFSLQISIEKLINHYRSIK